ncbi:MAG: FHA domain-containing protein [Acidothermus sp.]|nr:FHA domain-containing protein [Acidothermus sp.]MCL6537323.1 FHA domain-containing protein [Acidothermus sp.]
MSELSLFLLRVGFLALLWIFVIVAFGIIRSDLSLGAGGRVVHPPARKPARRPAAAPGKSARRLVVVSGSLAGTSIALGNSPVTIGRANDSTLVLTDEYASNRHARLFPRDGQWYIEDLGSTNGTFLDRVKVTQPTNVPLRTPIRIGKTVLELRR